MFGAMFAPRPDVVASELCRVCRPGGEIAMVNWTPTGFIGELFKVTGKHVAPPAGVPSPLLWGDEATVRERFSGHGTDIRVTPGHCADRVVKEILMFFARIDDLRVLDFNGEGSPLASFGSKSSNRVSRT
jgi:hypothetical protein